MPTTVKGFPFTSTASPTLAPWLKDHHLLAGLHRRLGGGVGLRFGEQRFDLRRQRVEQKHA